MLLPAHSAQDQVLLLGGRLPCRVRLPRDWCSRRLVVAPHRWHGSSCCPPGENLTELAKLFHRLSKQYGRIFRANKLDQKIKIILVLSSVAMSGQWEAVSLDLWPGVGSILLPWDRPPRPPLTLITAETCPPCPPRARVPRHFIATASYFTPSTSQQVNRSCII